MRRYTVNLMVNGNSFNQHRQQTKWEMFCIPEKKLKFCIKRGFHFSLSVRKHQSTPFSLPWNEWQPMFFKLVDGEFHFSQQNICKLEVLIQSGGAIKLGEYDSLMHPDLDPVIKSPKNKSRPELESFGFASLIQF